MDRVRAGDEENMDRLQHSPSAYDEAQLRRAARTNRIRHTWYALSDTQRIGVGLAAAGLLIALLTAL